MQLAQHAQRGFFTLLFIFGNSRDEVRLQSPTVNHEVDTGLPINFFRHPVDQLK